jgi:hypothetical protein
MAHTASDGIKQDGKLEIRRTERAIRVACVTLISVAVVGGLYLVVRLLG